MLSLLALTLLWALFLAVILGVVIAIPVTCWALPLLGLTLGLLLAVIIAGTDTNARGGLLLPLTPVIWLILIAQSL